MLHPLSKGGKKKVRKLELKTTDILVPTKVVAKNFSGFKINSYTFFARLSPLSFLCRKLTIREDTKLISLAAKKPCEITKNKQPIK